MKALAGVVAVALVVFVGAFVIAPVGVTLTEQEQSDAEVLKAITERLDAYNGIASSGDMEGWLSYWTPNVRAMEPGMDLSGQDFFDMGKEFFESGGKVSSAEWRTEELFVHGNVAYQIGEIHEAFQYAGEEPGEAHNHIFVRWEKGEDGVWKISRFLGSPIDAPAGG
jgi:ketosteroid isomerase-like protein